MSATDLLVTLDSEGPLPGWLQRPSRYDSRPAAVDPARFVEFARTHAAAPRYTRAILVGDGEALEQHGFELAQVARAAGFEHVRLLTSPARLTEARTIRAVVQAGVDEFALGLLADDAALHDELRGEPEDFAAVTTALTRLAQHEVGIFVDVVLTPQNLPRLPAMLELLGGHARVAELRLQPHAPPSVNLSRDRAERARVPSLDALIPALVHAAAHCRAAGLPLRLRQVPVCVLAQHEGLVELRDDTPPDALDGVRPGRPLPEFNCLVEAKCEDAERCGGLGLAHVNAHGWELARVQPRPRTSPWRERDRSVEQSTSPTAGPRGHGPWLALLGEHAAKVESLNLTRTEARCPMQLPDGTRIVLVISARDDDARTFVQTASFNVAYTDVDGPAPELEIAAYLEPVFATLAARDDGSLTLDAKA